MDDPKFLIFTGPMFGGKTSKMFAALEREKYRSRKILACKPKMDHRYSDDHITTHTGYKWPAVCVSSGQEIVELAAGYDVIAVDEAFMIDGSADALIRLFKSGKSVFVSSIQLSASGAVFDEIKDMMPWATKIEVCPAICEKTGKDAYYTVRIASSGDEIEIGGSETYQPRSWSETTFLRKQ
jgi:thymidine kinase